MMQQTLNQMLQLMSAQQTEQLKMKSEISQLSSEINRIQSAQTPDEDQKALSSQLETTLGACFDRQLKKMDDMNSPAKTQQVLLLLFIHFALKF